MAYLQNTTFHSKKLIAFVILQNESTITFLCEVYDSSCYGLTLKRNTTQNHE